MSASSADSNQSTTRRRRNPDARRQAIVRAAADLLAEGEGGDVTHRRVAERANVALGSTTYYFKTLDELRAAGLDLLLNEGEEALADIRRQAAEAPRSPEVLAELLLSYLTDRDRIRTDAALYGAAVQRPQLHSLALRRLEGMVTLFTDWTDPATAWLLAALTHGVALRVTLGDESLDITAIARAMTALMRSSSSTAE